MSDSVVYLSYIRSVERPSIVESWNVVKFSFFHCGSCSCVPELKTRTSLCRTSLLAVSGKLDLYNMVVL